MDMVVSWWWPWPHGQIRAAIISRSWSSHDCLVVNSWPKSFDSLQDHSWVILTVTSSSHSWPSHGHAKQWGTKTHGFACLLQRSFIVTSRAFLYSKHNPNFTETRMHWLPVTAVSLLTCPFTQSALWSCGVHASPQPITASHTRWPPTHSWAIWPTAESFPEWPQPQGAQGWIWPPESWWPSWDPRCIYFLQECGDHLEIICMLC